MLAHNDTCENCNNQVPGYDIVYLTTSDGTKQYCLECYNKYIADSTGVDFQHVKFDSVTLKDSDGRNHTFNFVVRLLGIKVSIEAFELIKEYPSGYTFMILGHSEEDEILELFGTLFERIRRALSRKHIKHDKQFGWQITDEQVVRGHIGYDENNEDERLPCIMIDGKELSWNDFGRMLMTFEGFNFKLQLHDRSEEM